MKMRVVLFALPLACLAACQSEPTQDIAAGFDEISDNETVYFAGNEPFWGGEVAGSQLRYSKPEDADGETITISRFVGNSGLAFSGSLDGEPFDLTVTAGECSDTMADRTYPYTATLKLGDNVLSGCAWTDAQPFEGDPAP